MIGFFQKLMSGKQSNRWLFTILLAIIVFSFVLYTGSGSAMDLLGMSKNAKVFGVEVNGESAKPYRHLLRISGAENMSKAQYLQTFAQLAYIAKLADEMQIPNPTEEEFADAYKRLLIALQGEATPQAQARVLALWDMTEEQFKDLILLNYKIQTTINLLTGTPSCFPEMADLQIQTAQTRWTVEVARGNAESFTFDGEPTDEELQNYFTLHAKFYEIPPQLHFAYAIVEPTDADRAAATNPDEAELKMFVQSQTADAEKALAENRADWVKRWQNDRVAVEVASRTSDMLAENLAQDLVNPSAEDFEDALKKSGLEFVDVPAFSQGSPAPECGVPAEIFNSMAQNLNSTLWRSDAIPMGEKACVIVYKKADPARIPELAEVRERVVADWKKTSREQKFLEAMRAKGEELVKAVDGGKEFLTAANELGFRIERTLPFAPANVPASLQPMAVNVVEVLNSTPEGKISMMQRCGDDVVFVRAAKKDVPAVDKNSDEYARFANYFERLFASQSLQAQMSERISLELAKSGFAKVIAEEE